MDIPPQDTDEAKWWDKYGYLNDRLWEQDDFLNKVVRSDYLAEMQAFLFKPGGRLLDFGCGTGWFSLPLAQQGMVVEGIDSSPEQIHRAQETAQTLGLKNVRFWCANQVSENQRNSYEGILLHAILHHIPIQERRTFMIALGEALVAGGKLYIYEPLAAMSDPPWQAWIADRVMDVLFRVIRQIAWWTSLYEPDIAAAMRAGWTMRSPEEQPAQLDELLNLLPPQFSIVKVRLWHCWSIAYANFCMSLRPVARQRFEHFAPVFYAIDRNVQTRSWYSYLRCWPKVSIMAQKSMS